MVIIALMTTNPLDSAAWEIWYEDKFDRECPPKIDASGFGLAQGLSELWVRHLFETAQPNGQHGFSQFWLYWTQVTPHPLPPEENACPEPGRKRPGSRVIGQLQNQGKIMISGDWRGEKNLREWLFRNEKNTAQGDFPQADSSLLAALVDAHIKLMKTPSSTEQILNLAATAKDATDFKNQLQGRGNAAPL